MPETGTNLLAGMLGGMAQRIAREAPRAHRTAVEQRIREEHPDWPNAKVASAAKWAIRNGDAE